MICAKYGRNWPTDSGEVHFQNLSMYFHYFVIIAPWKRAGPFIWTKLNPLHPEDDLCNVWLKLAPWFLRRFLKFVNVFSLFRNCLPLKKDGALHLNKLEFPSPKDALCQVWLKLAQWFWRRIFLKFVIYVMYFTSTTIGANYPCGRCAIWT